MMRQYIGARYTPKFTGVYDNTRAYENLEVVDNGVGTTYISKKPVPPNTPLTNTEYWAVYGASSGAILDLQTRMTDAENNITDLGNDISDVNDSIADINDDISELEEVNTVEKKILIITDSYGLNLDGSGNSMRDIAQSYLPDYSIEMEATSSGSFGGNIKLEAGLNAYTGDKSKIGHIIVVAGANDCSSNVTFSTIISGMNDFNTNARTNYPNADISLIACGTCYVANSSYSADQRFEMVEAYMTGANNYGWGFAENSQYLLHDTRLLKSDLLHPNETGVQAIGKAIAQFILTGVVNFYHRMQHSSFSGSPTNIYSCTVNFDELFINSELMWYRNSAYPMLSVTLTNAVAVASTGVTDWIDHGEMTNRMVDTFSSGNKWVITIPAQITHSDNSRSNGYVQYSIQFGKVYGRIWTPSNSNVKSYQTCGDCVIVPKM